MPMQVACSLCQQHRSVWTAFLFPNFAWPPAAAVCIEYAEAGRKNRFECLGESAACEEIRASLLHCRYIRMNALAVHAVQCACVVDDPQRSHTCVCVVVFALEKKQQAYMYARHNFAQVRCNRVNVHFLGPLQICYVPSRMLDMNVLCKAMLVYEIVCVSMCIYIYAYLFI